MINARKDKQFIPLSKTDLSDEEVMDIYGMIRFAFEQNHPDNMVDASDAYVLTVFPFKRGNTVPDNFDVVNYETGLFDGEPALHKVDGENEILVFD